MWPWLHSSHWSPISLVPQCDLGYTVLIGSPSHWSPNATLISQFSLVPQYDTDFTFLIGPPPHWSSNATLITVLIGPPSHWSPNATLVIQFSLVPHLIDSPMRPWLQFSLVPHLIDPPMRPWFHSSHWSPISLVPQYDPDFTVLIGPPSHWSSNATLITVLVGSPSHWSPQCNPGNPVLTGSPSHWLPGSPIATLSTLFSLFPHLTGLSMQPLLFNSHYYTFINTDQIVPMIDWPLLLNRSNAFGFVLSREHSYDFDVKGGISHDIWQYNSIIQLIVCQCSI